MSTNRRAGSDFVELVTQGVDPGAHATRARLYAKDVAGAPGLFLKRPDASVVELGAGGGASSFIANSTSASGTGRVDLRADQPRGDPRVDRRLPSRRVARPVRGRLEAWRQQSSSPR